jgi:hypothetical protein
MMNTITAHSISLVRQQEAQKVRKILVYGVGGSLLAHGLAVIAFNYLPQPASVPVEVTLVELSADLEPTPPHHR